MKGILKAANISWVELYHGGAHPISIARMSVQLVSVMTFGYPTSSIVLTVPSSFILKESIILMEQYLSQN